MGATNYQMALGKRYSKLKGQLVDVQATIIRIEDEQRQIPELRARIPELKLLITSLENLLRAEDQNWKPQSNPPIKPWTRKIPVPFGSTSRRAFDVLRRAETPMTAREIAIEVLRQAGTPDPSREIILRTTNTIGVSLKKFEGRTVESSGQYPAQWRVIHKPHVEFDI